MQDDIKLCGVWLWCVALTPRCFLLPERHADWIACWYCCCCQWAWALPLHRQPALHSLQVSAVVGLVQSLCCTAVMLWAADCM